MQSGQNITLDFILKNKITLTAKQNDINSRYFNITIKNNGQNVVFTDTTTAILNITKKNNQKTSYIATIENNIVVAVLPAWEVKVDGILTCDISIIDGNERLTTMPFKVEVVQSFYTSEDIQDNDSTDVLTYLLDKVKDVDTIKEEVLDNTSELSDINTNLTTLNINVQSNTTSINNLDTTVLEHTTSIDNLDNTINSIKVKRDTITILSSSWVQNQDTKLYEYEVSDTYVTSNHFVEVVMDIQNQLKLKDGYIESFNGSYKFYTTTLPTEDITATVVISLTEEVE